MEEIAKTTSIIIEYLVGGILILLSVGLLIFSISPTTAQLIFKHLVELQTFPDNDALSGIITLAIAYGVGVISEYVGQIVFEKRLDEIKRKRLIDFVQENESILEGDDILKEYVDLLNGQKYKELKEKKKEEFDNRINSHASSCIGQMRFYVLMRNQYLYGEIDSQIGRLRLVRVLFLVEIVLTLALVGFLIFRDHSLILFVLTSGSLLFGLATWKAVHSRYERYCRAIERSYKSLLIDQKENH